MSGTHFGVSVKSIERSAFQLCGKLASITIPNSVTSIGDFAFDMCASLTSVTMANSVKSIGYRAFSYSGLTSVTMSNSVTCIGEEAFAACSELTSITIPNSVTSIEAEAFAACYALTSISIPNSVTSIGGCAFLQCRALVSVTFPNSVTSIGDYAFDECEALTSVTITNSVTSIGKGAFYSAFGIPVSVTNLSKIPQEIDKTVFCLYGTLHVLPGCKAVYEVADVWKNFTIVEDAKFTSNMVSDMIAVIGKVEKTEESKAKIIAARSAYDALTKEQQALVKNFNALVDAENAYKQFETTGIASVETKDCNKDGKYIENGKIVIVKNGKNYNINGQAE